MKLNEVFKVQNCPICGKEPFVGACEDADGSEATIRCPCGLAITLTIVAVRCLLITDDWEDSK